MYHEQALESIAIGLYLKIILLLSFKLLKIIVTVVNTNYEKNFFHQCYIINNTQHIKIKKNEENKDKGKAQEMIHLMIIKNHS